MFRTCSDCLRGNLHNRPESFFLSENHGLIVEECPAEVNGPCRCGGKYAGLAGRNPLSRHFLSYLRQSERSPVFGASYPVNKLLLKESQPEAKLDRFLFNCMVKYLSHSEELDMMRRVARDDEPELKEIVDGPSIPKGMTSDTLITRLLEEIPADDKLYQQKAS